MQGDHTHAGATLAVAAASACFIGKFPENREVIRELSGLA
jgi:hypothetical protein